MHWSRSLLIAAVVGSVAGLPTFAIAQDAPAQEAAAPAADPVDFRKLKEILPETLVGLKRSDHKGEKFTMGDFKVSQATAVYSAADKSEEAEDENAAPTPHVDVQIVDYGSKPEMAQGMAYWTQIDIDQEGDDGYQRSMKIGEHPGLESFQNDGNQGTLLLLVGGRFTVTVNTSHVESAKLQEIAKGLSLDKLAELKAE